MALFSVNGSRSFDQLRIIAVTANALQGERQRCLTVGMNDYLTKPITIRDLGEVLRRVVGARIEGRQVGEVVATHRSGDGFP